MSDPTTPLDYANPSTPNRRWWWFHIWLLPLIWLPGTIGSTKWVGDEYGGWAAANLPGVPIMLLAEHTLWGTLGRWSAPLCTLPIVIAVGFLMDRMRAPRKSYFFLPLIFAWAAQSGLFVPGNIPPLPSSMIPAQRWEPSSLCVAYCWSVYLFAILSLTMVPLVRTAIRVRRADPTSATTYRADNDRL